MRRKNTSEDSVNRRTVTGGGFATLGLAAFEPAEAAVQQRAGKEAPIPSKDNLKITKLETILVKPRWLFRYLDLPTGPGLGIELGENAMADRIGHDRRNPQSCDADDGSVVDW